MSASSEPGWPEPPGWSPESPASCWARCKELNTQINGLDAELRVLVRAKAPALLDIRGCGVLSAAVFIGETAGVHRFASQARFARFTGTAPVPVWSGASAGKFRLNRGGNRDMNCALQHRDHSGPPRRRPRFEYIAKQTERGKGHHRSRPPPAPPPLRHGVHRAPNRPRRRRRASHHPRGGSLTT